MDKTQGGPEKLRASEERYQRMIAEVQDYAIILLDVDGNIQNWNLGAEQIKGYKADEIVGSNFRVFYRESDRLDQLPERLINEALRNGRAMHEGWRVRKDGTMFWGSVVITALHDNDTSVIGFSKVTRDLTERKLAEDQIKNYTRDIEFRNKQLEDFAYIASHDLQEPLRKIHIFTEMLQNSLDDRENVEKYSQKITAAAERMSNLVTGILKYSQISGPDELFEPVDLKKIIADINEDYELLMFEKQVKFSADGLPVIKAIPVQMQQLFGNLIGNAIKFSGADPEISIASRPLFPAEVIKYNLADKDINYVMVVVADNGLGFEQKYADQIFRIFKRLTDNPGTGIGLALCKKIVENHRGHIEVTSAPGKGSVFTVILPE